MKATRLEYGNSLLALLVLGTAAVARFGLLLTCGHDPQLPPPVQVQDTETAITLVRPVTHHPTDRDILVDNLRQWQSYSGRAPLADWEEKTAHLSPGYPTLVAWLYGWQGDPATTTTLLRWAQCILGSVTALLVFLFARRAFAS